MDSRFDLYIKGTEGTTPERLLLKTDRDKYVTGWSADGRYLTFTTTADPKTKADLWLLPLFGDRQPVSVARTEFRETSGSFSPDARWIAYQSDETGRFEIYARPLDGSAGKSGVSVNGGSSPIWSRDGKTVYFMSIDRKEMAASVRFVKETLIVDAIRPLFGLESRDIIGALQDVDGSGTRFLAIVSDVHRVSPPITLVLNWDEELKKK